MPRFLLIKKAVVDLASIWNYTLHAWSEEQAEKYYHLLLDTCERIAENPNIGKSYENITTGLLGFRMNKHIIFYRVLPDQPIEITVSVQAQCDKLIAGTGLETEC